MRLGDPGRHSRPMVRAYRPERCGQLCTGAEACLWGGQAIRFFACPGVTVPSSSKQASNLRADSSQVKSAERARARLARASRRSGSLKEHSDRAGDRRDVGRVEEDARVADDLRQRAGPARQDRRAARHRLDGRQAESFQQRRLNQGIGTAVQIDEIVVRDKSGQDHAIVQVVPRDGRADLRHVGVEDVVNVADQARASRRRAATRANASTRRSRFLCGLRPPT